MYKVFARKYRPSKLDEIVGQEVVIQILKNAISTNRLHHAILLSGPMGTGKTSIARIIAKSLNCESGVTTDPCNSCESCISISKGRNVDVYEIDGASNRKIEDARTIIEGVKYPPMNCRYKVYIIDEVHMFTNEAFNAMLKTLEEPPDYVKFIFATTAIEKLPDTIISRCQVLNLTRIPSDLIKKKLQYIATNEHISISNDGLDIISFASFGSLRVAEGYLDRCVSYKSDNLQAEDISKIIGVTSKQVIKQYFDYVLNNNVKSALEIIQNLYDKSINFEILSQQFIDYLLSVDISKEYKAALLNIYYKAFVDIKQKMDEFICLNVATYKACAVSDLDKIDIVIEKLLNTDIDINHNRKDVNKTNRKTDANILSNSSEEKHNSESNINNKENNNIDGVLSKNVKKILEEFGGKIVNVEKINK